MGEPLQTEIRADCAAATGDGAGLERLRNQRILITGGTGFMGTWLAETIAYLNDARSFGIDLHLLSRNLSRFSAAVPHLAKRGDVHLIGNQVSEVRCLPAGVTYVIHAAGTPDNRVHASDPLGTLRTIAGGTSAILQAAFDSRDDIQKILVVSSGLVYGAQPLELPRISETHAGGPEPDSITAVYAEAKRYGETVGAAWRSQFKLPVVTARPFAFMGPYQGLDKPWAVNNFLRDALLGAPIRILGDAQTVRSYMYPSDMAHWILRILAAGVPGTAYNVGSPHAITLDDLAHRIGASMAEPIGVVCRPLGEPRVTRFVPDVTRAQSELGLGITVDLDTAISRTLEWHRANERSK